MEFPSRPVGLTEAVHRSMGMGGTGVTGGITDADRDQALVRRLSRGDREALRELYESHGARVHRLCLRLLGRAAEAEDATQEVFVRLFERAADFDGRARFTTWLHRVTTNLCLKALERERLRRTELLADGGGGREPGDGPADRGPLPGEALESAEAEAELGALLARLSPEHRSVVVLRELEGLSYREIAEILAVPAGTVMSRLARAREHLVRLARASVPASVSWKGRN
jgi:RNA polymerase sigma-70 factor (ECF subfamily)